MRRTLGILLLCICAGCPTPPDLTPIHARITEGDGCIRDMKEALPKREYRIVDAKYGELREKYVAIAAKIAGLDLPDEDRVPIMAALAAWEVEILSYRKVRQKFIAHAKGMIDEPFTVEGLKRQGMTEEEAKRVEKEVREYYNLDRAEEHERKWNRLEAELDRAMKAVAAIR